MPKRITIEEEKEVGRLYAWFSQAEIREQTNHGTTQIARILQSKNLAWLLYHEIAEHGLTKYANKHLQKELSRLKILLIVTSTISWMSWYLATFL